jgi:hypothetical protein
VRLFSSAEMIQLIDSPTVAFILLIIMSHLFYLRFFSHEQPTLASGSIVMALGIIGLETLMQLGFPYYLMLYVALEVMIIGFYLGVNLIQGILEDEIHIRDPSDELAIGTWVAGSVISVLLLNLVQRTLLGFVALLSIIALTLYVYYLFIILRWYYLYLRKRARIQVNGMLLLTTVATESIAILFSELFHEDISPYIYYTIIDAGLVFYVVGLFCILQYLYKSRSRHVIASWVNENAIHHGALSITGVAMIESHVFPDWSIHLMWWVVLVVFIFAECLDISRLFLRIKMKSLIKAIGTYHISQWSRVFTIGTFYAFNVLYYEYEYSEAWIPDLIVHYGQYVVAAIFLAQLIILVRYINQKEKTK